MGLAMNKVYILWELMQREENIIGVFQSKESAEEEKALREAETHLVNLEFKKQFGDTYENVRKVVLDIFTVPSEELIEKFYDFEADYPEITSTFYISNHTVKE